MTTGPIRARLADGSSRAPSALVIRAFGPRDGDAVVQWRYPPPYDFYNADHAQVDDPAQATTGGYAIVEDGELVGCCTFGADARAPGGTYPQGPLDLGIAMRPDLTGRGRGGRYLAAAIEFARRELGATTLRASVAESNARALRLCERAGFGRVSRFDGPDRPYWILIRDDARAPIG